MFKKSLVAVAALATFSAGAMAANVELYGVVDMGFSYTHTSHQEKGELTPTNATHLDSREVCL